MGKTFIGYDIKDTGALAPTATPSEVNANRRNLSLYNAGAETVYIGFDETVSSTTGYPLKEDKQVMIKTEAWLVTASGTGDIRYAEVGTV